MGTTKTPTELVGLRILGSAGVSAGANEAQMKGASGWMVVKTKGDPDMGQVTISQEAYDALVAKANATVESKPEDEVAKALAALPDAVAKAAGDAIAKANETAAAAVKKAEETAEALAKAQRTAAEKDALALAKEWAHLPVNEVEFSKAFVDLVESNPTLADFVKTLMSAAEAVASTSKGDIFDEVGKALTPEPDAGSSAEVALDRIAKGLIEKDPTLSYAVAYTKAVESNPALYRQHRDANPNRVDADA